MEPVAMELIELGLDRRLRDQALELGLVEDGLARVTVVDRGQYIVRNAHGELPAKATGKFMYAKESTLDMPCVGDWVSMEYHDSEKAASIHTLLPRRSFLRRKSAGRNLEFQMIAANIDVAFIVQSCHYDFNVSRLERYLVMANEGGVTPLLILSKTDLVSAGELQHLIAEIQNMGIDTTIIALSNVTGAGLDQVKALMERGKTYCLVGSSGVGKSTLINRLTGEDSLKTRSVSASGEGRHTTVRRQLIVLEQGAMLIDTPGMREVGILGASEEVDENFDDIKELSLLCRFTNCSHSNEPGCAIQESLNTGALQPGHYQNYLKLKLESESNDVSYLGNRKRGKLLGKSSPSVKKRQGRVKGRG